jgi:hypothetical protein
LKCEYVIRNIHKSVKPIIIASALANEAEIPSVIIDLYHPTIGNIEYNLLEDLRGINILL